MSVTGVVVRDDGRVPVIKRAVDGRRCRPGECWNSGRHRKTASREVLEETGVRVQPERLIGVYKDMKLGVVSPAILYRSVSGREHATDEAAVVARLTPDEAAAAEPEARAVRIAGAFRDDGQFVRVHGGTSLIG